MRVHVLYFAVVRERLRRDDEWIDVAAGASVSDLLDELSRRHPALATLRPHLQVARNQEIARPGAELSDGDQVALIPPVAGGAGAVEGRVLREQPLEVGEVIRTVTHDGAGAIVSFIGAVRRESRGRHVERLEYEAYAAMAEARIRAIAEEVAATHAGARVAILHRVGRLAVGDVAVVIAASAPHRAEAFAACREAIERLKQEVPIWKKEIGDDGEEWVGLGP